MKRITAINMKYLLQLLYGEEKKNSLSKVAKSNSVSPSTVMRSLSVFLEQGILDENYKPTNNGQRWIANYRKQKSLIESWLIHNHITVKSAEENALSILENCSEDVLDLLKKKGEIYQVFDQLADKKADHLTIENTDLYDYFPENDYPVSFIFYKDWEQYPINISMANEGFRHPGILSIKKGESLLKLERKWVKQESMAGGIVPGIVTALSYESDDQRQSIEIIENIAKIPVSAFRFIYDKNSSFFIGELKLRMTCSAGDFHMPESTAILNIYLNE